MQAVCRTLLDIVGAIGAQDQSTKGGGDGVGVGGGAYDAEQEHKL